MSHELLYATHDVLTLHMSANDCACAIVVRTELLQKSVSMHAIESIGCLFT